MGELHVSSLGIALSKLGSGQRELVGSRVEVRGRAESLKLLTKDSAVYF